MDCRSWWSWYIVKFVINLLPLDDFPRLISDIWRLVCSLHMQEPPRASSFVGWCHHDGTTACIKLCRMMPSWFSCSRIPLDGFQGMDYEWSIQEITSIRRFRSEEHKADHRRRGLDDDAAGSCKSSMAADGCALWQESVCNKNTKTDQKMPVPTTVLSRLSCS